MKWLNYLFLNESFADYLSFYAMSKGKLFPDSFEYLLSRKECAYVICKSRLFSQISPFKTYHRYTWYKNPEYVDFCSIVNENHSNIFASFCLQTPNKRFCMVDTLI